MHCPVYLSLTIYLDQLNIEVSFCVRQPWQKKGKKRKKDDAREYLKDPENFQQSTELLQSNLITPVIIFLHQLKESNPNFIIETVTLSYPEREILNILTNKKNLSIEIELEGKITELNQAITIKLEKNTQPPTNPFSLSLLIPKISTQDLNNDTIRFQHLHSDEYIFNKEDMSILSRKLDKSPTPNYESTAYPCK